MDKKIEYYEHIFKNFDGDILDRALIEAEKERMIKREEERQRLKKWDGFLIVSWRRTKFFYRRYVNEVYPVLSIISSSIVKIGIIITFAIGIFAFLVF